MDVRRALLLCALLPFHGCKADDAGGGGACPPGLALCQEGSVFACKDDGSGFEFKELCTDPKVCRDGACVEPGPGAEGEGEEGICSPGATQACVCAGGRSGAQVCAVGGGAWGACDCGPASEGEGEEGEGEEGEGEPGEGEGEGEGEEGEGEGDEGEGEEGEGDEGEGDEGEGEGPGPVGCLADEPCEGAQTCDRRTGRCIEPAVCGGDVDCLGERICVRGACAAPCRRDGDCPGTRRCELATGRCPEAAFCIVDADCDLDRICVAGDCADGCADDDACPGAQTCDLGARTCREPAVCAEDLDCMGDRICQGAACRDRCRNDGQCPGRQTCDEAAGRCEEPALCASDDDCLGARVCEDGDCVLPGCDESVDCQGGGCVDRVCGPRPGAACTRDDQCPGDLSCAPVGACGVDGLCGGDDDCPAQVPVCDALTGRCVQCRSGVGCADAEVCDAGWCRLARACADNGDCPGARICAGGVCRAAGGCDGDAFDALPPADRTLQGRIYTGLELCDGAEDVYRVRSRAGEGLRVTLRHDPATGPLTLSLRPPGFEDGTLARSRGGHGHEVVGVDASGVERRLEVIVRGAPGGHVTYSLAVDRLGVADCVPDRWEGLFGNNDAAHAALLRPGEATTRLCVGDEDWFAVDLSAGSRLSVRALSDAGLAGLALTLSNPAGGPDTPGLRAGDGLAATLDATVDGHHLVRLRQQAADPVRVVTLEVLVEATPGGRAAACAAAVRLDPGVPWTLPPRSPSDRLGFRCDHGQPGPPADHVAWFDLDRSEAVTVRLLGGGPNAEIAIRSDCEEVDELECATGDGDVSLVGVGLGEGRWFVVARATPADPPAQVLLVGGLSCEDEAQCPGGFLCDGGRCRTPCAADEDCSGSMTCDVPTGHCREHPPCSDDRDCAGRRACEPHVVQACFDAECETHADCGAAPDRCVDRRCGALAQECSDAGDCGAGQACSADGACVPRGACNDDDDCPAGLPVCNRAASRCEGCLDDDDCFRAEACRPIGDADGAVRICRYVGFCQQHADCPGARWCNLQDRVDIHLPPECKEPAANCYSDGLACADDGDCPAMRWPDCVGGFCVSRLNAGCERGAPCAGDRFDGADGPVRLRLRAYTGLVLCDGTTDTYRVVVPADEGVRIVLRHDPAAGDLRAALWEVGRPGEDVAASDARTGVEVVALAPAAAVRAYDLVIQGARGRSVAYSVILEGQQ